MKYKSYKDTWYLHGVEVTEEEFNMPPEKVDVMKYIVKEKNVQRRMAFLQKVGVERFVQKTGAKEVDTYKLGDNEEFPFDEYTLLLVDINGKHCPYLKMKNASTGVYVIEGVSPDCKTAKEGFDWRYSKKFKGEDVEGLA